MLEMISRHGGGSDLRRYGVRWLLRWLGGMVVVSLGLAWCTSSARAFVYWADTDGNSIGRANLDGSGVENPFLALSNTLPCGVAVGGRYLYWSAGVYPQSIGRAPIDGVGKPDPDFITGVSSPCGLAIYGQYLYWTNGSESGSVGRASLQGPKDVQENFVPSEQALGGDDLEQPCGIAVDASGIYWSDRTGGVIGHANLDGTGERTLLTRAGPSCGVALAGDFLYWTSNGFGFGQTGTIGRALKSGADADNTFITGLNGPCGVAVYSNYLYFADGSTIDRADLSSADPTASTQQIVMGNRNACGVAVDDLYRGQLIVGRRRSSPHGHVSLALTVSNPGSVTVKQSSRGMTLVKTTRMRVARAGSLTVKLRPTAAALTRLRTHRRITARLTISYTPSGGVPSLANTTVVLARR